MPAFNGTGPRGMGPMSGRGFGLCGLGLGWRQKFGQNRGMGRYFNWKWPKTEKTALQALKDYQTALEEELEDVKKELREAAEEK